MIGNLASDNIQYGFGLEGRYDLARIARSLEGADVIALQELTRGFSRNGFADMVADVAGWPIHPEIVGKEACNI
ncbi:endonuclease, partial [Rhizobium ruizarguesonis]